MKPGTLALGRYRLEEALPAAEGQLRWRARDERTGEAVELVGPSRQLALRPGAQARFTAAQARPAAAPAALLPTDLAGQEEGRPLVARPLTQGPLPEGLRLDADQVLAVAAWLGPAALAAEAALEGELGPADLVLDTHGAVRLAPAGLVPSPTELRPPFHRAPEVARGSPVVPGSALYGLGVTLYRALTGAWPVSARTRAELLQAGPPRPASALLPGLPLAVDALLAALLSADPDQRRAALARLPAGAAVVLPAVSAAPALAGSPLRADSRSADSRSAGTSSPPLRAGRAASTAVRTTRDAPPPPSSRVDRVLPPWAVLVDGAGLTGAARARAGALLDRPAEVVQGLLDAGLPLPVAEAATQAQAETQAALLAGQGLPARVAPTHGGTGSALGKGLLAALLLAAATTSLVLAPGLAPLSLVLAGSLLLLALALGLTAGQAAARARAAAQVRQALHHLDRSSSRAEDALDRARAELRGAHRAVLQADLPPPVRLDLEEALADLDHQLDRLQAAPADATRDQAIAQTVTTVQRLAADLVPAAPGGAVSTDRIQDHDKDLEARIRQRAAAARAATTELGEPKP